MSRASNNSPRGIWSDGDVMFVADASDARLASLTLSGVELGEFDPGQTEYEGTPDEGTTETAVVAGALQRRTDIEIKPGDTDREADGHQVARQDLAEISRHRHLGRRQPRKDLPRDHRVHGDGLALSPDPPKKSARAAAVGCSAVANGF